MYVLFFSGHGLELKRLSFSRSAIFHPFSFQSKTVRRAVLEAMADKHAKLGITTTKICCIGAGYVGGPAMATIALQCRHITVTIVDMNEARIAAWNAPDLPTTRPFMDVVKAWCRGRNLFFSTDVAKGIQDVDVIFASVNTPTKKSGIGAGRTADLRFIESAGRTIAQHSTSSKIVIEKFDFASLYRSCCGTGVACKRGCRLGNKWKTFLDSLQSRVPC